MPYSSFTFLLTFILLSSQSSSSSNPLIHQQCHNSQTPLVCITCLQSHPSETEPTNTTTPAQLAAVLLKCIGAHSTYLAANMTDLMHLPSNGTAVSLTLRPVFKSCSRQFKLMLKALPDAAEYLKRGDYDNANVSMKKAMEHQLTCQKATRGLEVEIGQAFMFYDMRVNDALSEAFMRIVDRL